MAADVPAMFDRVVAAALALTYAITQHRFDEMMK
jgi:hypothetical protein